MTRAPLSVEEQRRLRTVTPSQTSPWHGTPGPDGARWTVEQLETLVGEGRDPVHVDSATVAVRLENRGDWTMPGPVKVLLVPCLARTRFGRRALIIAPAGDKLWKDIV